MPAANAPRGAAGRRRRQSGFTAVEVGWLAGIFFALMFMVMELARWIYVTNTLQEVTRRAASELSRRAPGDPDSPAILEVRRRAIFREGEADDKLAFAAPVTIAHVRVDYQSLVRASDGSLQRVATSSIPSSSTSNRRICMRDPNDPCCVRFVRVRICTPGSGAACTPVRYQTAFPLFPLNVTLPRSSTIATVENLGYVPGEDAGAI